MFDSGANVPYALAAWGTLGTFWWYGLGRGIEFVWALGKRHAVMGRAKTIFRVND